MWLPAEVRDTIVSNLVEFDLLADLRNHRSDTPSWDALRSHLDEPVTVRDRGGATHRTRFAVPKPDIHTLLNLRQVSRSWYATANTVLAKYHHWTADFDHADRLGTALRACAPACDQRADGDDDNIPTAGRLVRNLAIPKIFDVVTFSRIYDYDCDLYAGDDIEDFRQELQIGGESCTYVEKLQPRLNRRALGSNNKIRRDAPMAEHYDKEHEHMMVRGLFDSIQSLESFSVAFMGASSHEQGRNREGHETGCYDEIGLVEMLRTIQYGLKSDAFASLSSLDLEVPTTHDVAVLSEALGQNAREKLRHLRLAIVDQTGPSGSHDYRTEEDNWDGALTQEAAAESGFYPSNWQLKYPNQQHQDEMFQFVASCRNLESLEIKATQFLDLDMLASRWCQNLKVLSLARFWTCASSLVKLLSAPFISGQKARIVRVSLHDIKIRANGGDWPVIFKHLREQCPDLEFCHMYQLAYLHGHPSYEHNNRPWENLNDLWTSDGTDLREKNALLRCLVAKAGGADHYPWHGQQDDLVDEDWW